VTTVAQTSVYQATGILFFLPGFWAVPENMNISHQSSGLYTGSHLHLGLILKYYYWYISHSMG